MRSDCIMTVSLRHDDGDLRVVVSVERRYFGVLDAASECYGWRDNTVVELTREQQHEAEMIALRELGAVDF